MKKILNKIYIISSLLKSKLIAAKDESKDFNGDVLPDGSPLYEEGALSTDDEECYERLRPKKVNVSLACYSNTSIMLTWTKSPCALGYEIYCSEAQGEPYVKIADTSGLRYLHIGLTPGRIYRYKVRAYMEVNHKTLYSELSDETAKRCGLAAPEDVKAVSDSRGITISWNRVDDAESYIIEAKSEKDNSFSIISRVPKDVLYYTDTSAEIGVTYEYRVRAFAVIDGTDIYGEFSKTVSATREPFPMSIRLSNAGSGRIMISYDKIPGAKEYEIYRSTQQDSTFEKIATTDATTLYYIDSSLDIGRAYYYKARPIVVIGEQSIPGEFSATEEMIASLGKVEDLKLTATDSKITLSWSEVESATGYEIFRRALSEDFSRLADIRNATSYTDASVKSNVRYFYYVSAYKSIEEKNFRGPASDIVSGEVTEAQETVKITSVEVYRYTRLLIRYTDVKNASGYELFRRSSSDKEWAKIATLGKGTLSYIDGAKHSGEEYSYRVRPYFIKDGERVYGAFSPIYSKRMPKENWGIDVSKWQGDIDWKKVAADGIGFAMIRASYTTKADKVIHTDEKFERNIRGAKAAGLKVGLYAYSAATSASMAKKEAQYIIKLAKNYSLELPIAYDFEGTASTKTYTAMAKTFLDTVSKAGFRACIYGTPSYMSMNSGGTHLDYEKIKKYPIWVARYRTNTVIDFSNPELVQTEVDRGYYDPRYPEANEKTVMMWQYSSTGRVDGISGNVDLDILY